MRPFPVRSVHIDTKVCCPCVLCVFVNWWFNHLGVLKHAQVRVHAQGFGFVASAFVKLCCLVEFPLVGIDVCQEQLIVVLTPLLPLLQISQHKHWHVWRDKHSHACTRIYTNVMNACSHTQNGSNNAGRTKNYCWMQKGSTDLYHPS